MSQTEIITRYVRDLEAVASAAYQLVLRSHDPKYRLDNRSPEVSFVRRAVGNLRGENLMEPVAGRETDG